MYNIGQAKGDHLLCRYFGSSLGTVLKIALFDIY